MKPDAYDASHVVIKSGEVLSVVTIQDQVSSRGRGHLLVPFSQDIINYN